MNSARKGLTLIELTVSAVVLVILAALLYPVFAQFREHPPRRITCLSNMKQVGMGLIMYTQDWDETFPNYRFLPLGTQANGDFEKNSWKSALMPYIKNRQVFVCPQNPSNKIASDDPLFKISYAANVALNPRDYPTHLPAPKVSAKAKGSGIFGRELSPGVNISDVRSPAECIAVVEMAHMKQNNFCVDIADDDYSIMGSEGKPMRVFSDVLFTGHGGLSNYVFADGHAKSLKPSATYASANFWYRDGSPLSVEGKLTLANAEAHTP